MHSGSPKKPGRFTSQINCLSTKSGQVQISTLPLRWNDQRSLVEFTGQPAIPEHHLAKRLVTKNSP